MKFFKRARLARGMRAAAEYQLGEGEITSAQHKEMILASRNNEVLDRVISQLEGNQDALGSVDWSAVKDWLIANWPTILRIVFSVAMLLMEPEDE